MLASKAGKCSGLLRNEMAEGSRQRTIDVFAIYDEIRQMEGSDPPRRTGTKPAKPFKYELNGLMHKHYKTSSLPDFMLNIKNHWKGKGSKAERHRIQNALGRDVIASGRNVAIECVAVFDSPDIAVVHVDPGEVEAPVRFQGSGNSRQAGPVRPVYNADQPMAL